MMTAKKGMYSLAAVSELVTSGRAILLAGDEALLDQVPRGNWIGGTIPYFMGDQGGLQSKELLHVSVIDEASGGHVGMYDVSTIDRIATDGPANGLTVCILPAGSAVHEHYAKHGPDFDDMFMKPLVGWVAGVSLDDIGRVKPQVYNGATGQKSDCLAVAMHVELPANKQANVELLNLFEALDAHTLIFDADGFSAGDCMIDGKRTNLARFISEHAIDTRMPLVADYNGFYVNVSIQSVDAASGETSFFAPVFAGVEYFFAKPVADYVESFDAAMADRKIAAAFSCNCILNYLYANLEGKKTGTLTGPMTFGEIAWQLLNQTLVWVSIVERPG
ncbi:hypothetical protein [Herbaspirillum sp. ST 5-3]|uniref:DUF6976 family protein n=1 Tax=Oxalobacteraceae TaxID=75682 RepID=UPI0010A4496D|nr:hypothetical protein [Herbaspirillum sp. ST 5-3]